MKNTVDFKYNELVKTILEQGEMELPEDVRTVYADGTKAPTKKIINYQVKYDTTKEVPLLTTKRVPTVDPVKEILWIWQKMSNDVNVLNEMGCKVWDEWKREDSTIGRAYGWQLKNKLQSVTVSEVLIEMFFNNELSFKPSKTDIELGKDYYLSFIKEDEYEIKLNQVDYLLYTLKSNPHSRRIKTTLWCVEDLHDMALQPCVYETHWIVYNGKLNLTVNVRSNDIALGNPYNVYQYFVLLKMIAQVTNYESGELCFNIDIPHIYDRHIDSVKEIIKNEPKPAPKFIIDPEVTDFYKFTRDSFRMEGYEYSDFSGKIPVAL